MSFTVFGRIKDEYALDTLSVLLQPEQQFVIP